MHELLSTDPVQFYKTIADASVDWEYWLLPDGGFAYVSPACKRLSGYSAAEFMAEPRLLEQVIDPRDREKMQRHFLSEIDPEAIAGLELNEIDFRIVTRDGQIRWLSHVCRAVFDRQGRFLGSRGSQRDITERKQKELELNTLKQAAEDVAVSIVITDKAGNIEYVNPKFCEMTGYQADEVLGRNPRMFRHPETKPEFYQELWATITSGKSWKGIFRNVRKDGRDYWEAATISPVFDEQGEIVRYAAGKEDISESLSLQQRLQESEEKFRLVVQKTPIPMCYMNLAGTVGFINDQFTATFGYSEEDLPNLDAWWPRAFPDENYRRKIQEQWRNDLVNAMKSGANIGPEERRIACKNGKLLTVLITTVILEENLLVGFVDITERKRQENLLFAAYDRKKRNETLNELVKQKLPSRRILAESLKMLGLKSIEPFTCFVLEPLNLWGLDWSECWKLPNECQKLLDAMIDELSNDNRFFWECPEGIGVLWYDEMLAAVTAEIQQQQARELLRLIAGIEPGLEVAVGISARAGSLEEVSQHYQQAVLAVEVGRKVWPEKRVYHYLDLGSYQLWPFLQDATQVEAYIERVLGKILAYESSKRQEYFDTLELIVNTDNLKEIAAQLGLHYKTLLFRKQRLEQIMELSLDVFRNRQTVATALQLYKLRRSTPA